MSAEPYADPTLPGAAGAPFEAPLTPVAQPAVDILPIAGARKGRPAEEQQYEPPAPADYAPPAETLAAAADIVPPPTWAAPSAPVAEAVPAAVNPWTGQVLPDGGPAPEAEAPSAKRFLGMQLRRPRRTDDSVDAAELAGSPHQVEAPAEVTVAAWPTDIGAQSVADAEPVHQDWAGPPAFAYAAADVMDAPAQPPVEAPVAEAPVAEAPPVEAPVAEAPPADAPIALAPVLGPVPFPVQAASASDEEVRAVRTLLDASDAQRASAEQRAEQAVAYGQQLQAELTRVREDLEGRLRAAETRGRAAANEAQDWQIRHREAETQVQELARAIAGSEQRLDDLRSERDELLSALEEATNPATAMARPGQPD